METELILDFGEKKGSSISKNKNSKSGCDKDAINPINKQVQKTKRRTVNTGITMKEEMNSNNHLEYNPKEIMEASTAYFGNDELAANVWMNKYALRDGDKIFELTPDQMHIRLASEFARIENN